MQFAGLDVAGSDQASANVVPLLPKHSRVCSAPGFSRRFHFARERSPTPRNEIAVSSVVLPETGFELLCRLGFVNQLLPREWHSRFHFNLSQMSRRAGPELFCRSFLANYFLSSPLQCEARA